MQNVVVKAPISGVIFPIEQVPDPVFSGKMVGDGISIDPVEQVLVAPFDGRVTQLHSAMHAVTVTHESGLEVMMHIGLDTVSLKSKGFTSAVSEGDQVVQGDTLIEFDADYIATQTTHITNCDNGMHSDIRRFVLKNFKYPLFPVILHLFPRTSFYSCRRLLLLSLFFSLFRDVFMNC